MKFSLLILLCNPDNPAGHNLNQHTLQQAFATKTVRQTIQLIQLQFTLTYFNPTRTSAHYDPYLFKSQPSCYLEKKSQSDENQKTITYIVEIHNYMPGTLLFQLG